MNKIDTHQDIVLKIGQWLMKNYWGPLHEHVKQNPSLLNTMPGFLLKPEKLIFYMGQSHIGIEYIGPERITELPKEFKLETQLRDYSLNDCNILEEIIGFNYNSGCSLSLPLPPVSEDLVLPTNEGADELERLNWNWTAQNMMVAFNTGCVLAPEGQFTRLINAMFFDASQKGGLKTRHIKWLDLIPCKYDDSGTETDKFSILLDSYITLAELDKLATYPIPSDFRFGRLQQMNRFIEFIGNKNHSEPDITKLLASNDLRFVLKMRFSATDIFPECLCEWYNSEKKAIKPDFFIVGPDGFADIVEFKLPEIKGSVVVGKNNRETFSATINSYISQTRVYREYFDDPHNRKHVEDTYGFKVYKPKRHLIIGRRWDFENEEWRAIAADYQDLIIHTFDDLIDGVVMQFYD